MNIIDIPLLPDVLEAKGLVTTREESLVQYLKNTSSIELDHPTLIRLGTAYSKAYGQYSKLITDYIDKIVESRDAKN